MASALAACGSATHGRPPTARVTTALPPDYRPLPVGSGRRYRPLALSPAVASARPVRGLRCTGAARVRFGAHLELFAYARVVVVPAGIGVAPPQRRVGARVTGGRCSYPLRTIEPTGVIEVLSGARLTLGDLFALWGQPLSRRALAGFRGPAGGVTAFVDGERWRGDPQAIPLVPHALIALEIGAPVLAHHVYLFPPGL